MKLLKIQVTGLSLFKEELDLQLYAKQRVGENDKERLQCYHEGIYLHSALAFIGLNASGKTSVLKVLQFAISLLNNEPLNQIETKDILGSSQHIVFKLYFINANNKLSMLCTEIESRVERSGNIKYVITNEQLYEKELTRVIKKKNLTDFSDINPIAVRENNPFLLDDVSFIIAQNKYLNDKIEYATLLSYTNINVLPIIDSIPKEVITFFDPTVEHLIFKRSGEKSLIYLKFYNKDEIVLNNPIELERYLSSGTIKGIIVFSYLKDILSSGGYVLLDEIENHFNKEIVATLIQFFMESRFNKKGATLFFTTHYAELLDAYDRNDGIYIVRNDDGITVKNLSNILTRNDIKKSDAYQSGCLGGTTLSYEAYINLKKSLSAMIEQ